MEPEKLRRPEARFDEPAEVEPRRRAEGTDAADHDAAARLSSAQFHEAEEDAPAVDVRELHVSFSLAAGKVISSDGDRDIVTKSASRVTLSVRSDRVQMWCMPAIFIDASWPAANMSFYGITYDLRTGDVIVDVVKGEGWGWMNYVPETQAGIAKLVRDLVAGTPLAARGYDPFADPNALGVLAAIGNKLASLPAAGGGGSVAAGDLKQVSAGGTVALAEPVHAEQDGGGIDIPAGGAVSIEVRGAGSIADVAGAKDPQGMADALAVQAVDLKSDAITLSKGGKPVAKLLDVTIARGGAVTVNRFSLEGTPGVLAGLEALVRLIGGALDASSRGAPDALAWELGARGADPTITTGITKSAVEKALTAAVRALLLGESATIQGVNLAQALGIK